MAQPSVTKKIILGSVEAKANESYLASDILLMKPFFSTANLFIFKSRPKGTKPVYVSINATTPIEIEFNEDNSYDPAVPLTYVFSEDCIIAVAKVII